MRRKRRDKELNEKLEKVLHYCSVNRLLETIETEVFITKFLYVSILASKVVKVSVRISTV